MSKNGYESITLTLINKDLETTTEFEGKFLGQAVQIYDDDKNLPQELIRIYNREDGKIVSYMEYSDDKDGIWESKVYVSEELKLSGIKEGLTRKSYNFGGLQVENVPSEILGIAVYRAVEKLEKR